MQVAETVNVSGKAMRGLVTSRVEFHFRCQISLAYKLCQLHTQAIVSSRVIMDTCMSLNILKGPLLLKVVLRPKKQFLFFFGFENHVN